MTDERVAATSSLTGPPSPRAHRWPDPRQPPDLPAADLPTTDLPATDLPATDLPATDLPTTVDRRRVRRWVGWSVLVVGLVLLVVSGLSVASRWTADQRTVHSLRDPGVHQVRLDAREYQIYSVATAGGAVDTRCFTVQGATGPLPVRSHSYRLSPDDVANAILQTGTFFPTAGFTVPSDGIYAVTARCLAPGQKVFVAEAQHAALRHVAPGLVGGLVGAGLLVAGLVLLRGAAVRRRPSGWITVLATTSTDVGPLT